MNLEYFLENPLILLLLFLWVLPWKGVALWKSAKNNQLNWFVFILVLNTFAILEITYIFFFVKDKREDSTK